MVRRGRRAWGVWGFPAAGFAVVGAAAAVPGSPLGPGRWPVRGPFGAFTWSAWFVAGGLGMTHLLLAVALGLRRGRAAGGVVLGRVVPAALAFGLVAVASYAAAARADRIAQHPAAALGVALAGLVALRAVVARLRPRGGGGLGS